MSTTEVTEQSLHRPTSNKRRMNITFFHIAMWVVTPFVVPLYTAWTQDLAKGFVLGFAMIFFSIPVKDYFNPAVWLVEKIAEPLSIKTGGGITTQPQLLPGKDKLTESSPWHKMVPLQAAFYENERSEVGTIPVLTTPDKKSLTAFLVIPSGAAATWINSDNEGRFKWDLLYIDALNEALATTREKVIYMTLGLISRPSDRTRGYEENNIRVTELHLAAADSPTGRGFDPVDKKLADHGMSSFNEAHDGGGELINYISINCTWPRKGWSLLRLFNRRVDISDPDVFEETNLCKTVKALVLELNALDVDIEVADMTDLSVLIDSHKNLAQMDASDTYHQRDREMEKNEEISELTEGAASQPYSWQPVSVTSDPDNPGHLSVDGTFITGGIVVAQKQTSLTPGFQQQALAMPKDVFYSTATCIKATLIIREKFKAHEAERAVRIRKSLKEALSPGLSNPSGEKALAEIEDWRSQLQDAGARSCDTWITSAVRGYNLGHMERSWRRLSDTQAKYYQYRRLMTPTQLGDLMLMQLGMVR